MIVNYFIIQNTKVPIKSKVKSYFNKIMEKI